MKIGVTGGRGFIGHHLVNELVDRGFEVVVLDNGYRALHDFPEREGLKVFWGDICRLKDLQVFNGCEVVINLAAVSAVMAAEMDPRRAFETNVNGVSSLIDFCRPRGIRVVQASSREVYGEVSKLPVNEDEGYAPKNVYGMSKALAEKILISARKDGAKISVLRLANVIGVGDSEPRVIPSFLRKASRGEALEIYGGGQVLDFIPVSLVVEALIKSAFEDCGPVNVASGRGTSILDLVGKISKIFPDTKIEMFPPRRAEVAGFQADVTRMIKWGICPPDDPLVDLPMLAEHYAAAGNY